MSRYQSSSTRLALTEFVRAQWKESAVSLCNSVTLTSLAEQLISPSLGADQKAPPMLAAAQLLTDPRLADLAQAAGSHAQSQLGEVRALLPAGPTAELPTVTAELFTSLIPALARQERGVVAGTAVDALGSLGYTVIHESGSAADGIEARRGHELMLLAVTDGGQISIGHLGADGACEDRQARFEAAMADRGVLMTTLAVDLHDDHADPLVSAAAAAGEASLALAVARNTVSNPREERARITRTATSRSRSSRRIRVAQQEVAP